MINKIRNKYNELVALFKGGYWNYRIIQKTNSYKLSSDKIISETYYEIHEVYYNEKNEIVAWSQEPMSIYFQNYNDYVITLKQIKKAIKYPILKLEGSEKENTEKLIETNKYLKDIKEYYPDYYEDEK